MKSNCRPIIFIFIFITVACNSKQDVVVPSDIESAFKKMHPGATNIRWIREPSLYEAKFKDGSMTGAVSFNDQADVIETEEVIDRQQLPVGDAIVRYVATHYPAEKISRCERVRKPDGTTTYEIQITGKELIFDQQGVFLAIEPD